MRKVLKWALIALGVLVLIGIFAGKDDKPATSDGNVRSSAQHEEPPIAVTATELLAAYQENEVGANAKYKGKRLAITGRIKSIEAGFGDRPYLTLAAGGQFEFASPHANMAKSEDSAVANLKKGQTVKLICIGDSEMAGTPILSECLLQ